MKQRFSVLKFFLAFFDLTRWGKDFGSILRGVAVCLLFLMALKGTGFLKKELSPQRVQADGSAQVKISNIERQKNSFLGIF